DFLVIDALASIAGLVTMGDVSFGRDGTEFAIRRHDRSLWRPNTASVLRFAAPLRHQTGRVAENSWPLLEARRYRLPALFQPTCEKLIGSRLVWPHGDRRQATQSGNPEHEMTAVLLQRDHEIVAVLVLKNDIDFIQPNAAPVHPAQHTLQRAKADDFVRQLRMFHPQDGSRFRIFAHCAIQSYNLPRRACSRSIASNSALKFPLPKLREPCRSITSKNSVGRSPTGFVKICSM